jgi:hypothetical protein
VTREGTRCVYEGPEELVAGAVNVVFFNAVDEKVGFHFARLHEDVAYSMYRETIQHEPVDGISDLVMYLNRADEGLEFRGELSQTATVTPGLHALTCVVYEGNSDTVSRVVPVRPLIVVPGS